jgi:hypothetical protein
MNFFTRLMSWFGRVLLPARLRPTVLQTRLQTALDRQVTGVEAGVAKVGKEHERIEGGEVPRAGVWGLVFRWVLHFLLVGLVLVLLYFVNRWLHLERVLRSDWPFLHAYWLPLIFLLLYLMAWMGYWIWELTGPEKLTNDFPDIDLAWKEVVRSTSDSGVNLQDVPLFLVVGQSLEGEDNVLLGAQFGFAIRDVPRWPDAAVRISANQQAAFITCPRASVLSHHLTLLVEEMREAQRVKELRPGGGDITAAAVAASVGGAETPAPQAAEQPATEATAPAPYSEEEQRVIGLLVAEKRSEQPAAQTKRRVFLKNKVTLHEEMARLQHLCQLIVRHRRPYCPINGILVLLPMAATATDEDAAQATTACQLDLSVIRETAQVQCPAFALSCDVEKVPGFRDFLQRIPAAQRDQRIGQRFPLVADVDQGALPDVVQDGMSWFANTFMPAVVYNLFRLEHGRNGQPPAGELPETVAGNMRLYQFLNELRQRRNRLARFLTRGLLLDSPPSYFFGGFYLAGTGPDAERDRGFVSGVFQRLPETQNYVAWTPDALAQDQDFRRWTGWGYLLFVVLLAIAGFLIVRLWFR